MGLSTRCTIILEHSMLISNRINETCNCSDVNAKPRFVSHTIKTLSSLPETAVVPSAETLTQVTWARWPAKVCNSSPVCISQTIRLQSFDPDMTWVLFVTETATQVTASLWPTSTWASLPPVACHTFREQSREPVIMNKESVVITKHVISSAWDTENFSSSRVRDHIFKKLSPFVHTWKEKIRCHNHESRAKSER